MKKLRNLINYFQICLLFIFFSACKEELITLSPPQIEINSIEEVAFGKFNIEIQLDLGENQQIKKVEVILEDITVDASPKIIKTLSISEEQNQIVTVLIDNAEPNHDYKVNAKVTTEEYDYFSDFKIIRASKNNFLLEILEDDYYFDSENNISDVVNRGDSCIVILYFQSEIKDKELKIKLNKTIELEHNLVFNGKYAENGGNKELIGKIYIPLELEPKDYELYAYIDGIEIKADNKIRVLEGTWNILDNNYPGENLDDWTWFVNGNDLFILGNYYSPIDAGKNFPVWKFNLVEKSWTKMKNFNHYNSGITSHKVVAFSDSSNLNNYITFYTNKEHSEIYKYIKDSDTWEFVTEYPINVTRNHLSFMIESKIFICERAYQSDDWVTDTYQLWSYDIQKEEWKQLNNLPSTIYPYFSTTCCSNGNGYVMESGISNRLWKYNPDDDTWLLMSRFPGIKRSNFNIVVNNDKIFLIGGNQEEAAGETFMDCWEFSPSENDWNLNSFIPIRSQSGIAFSWSSKIVFGMSYYQKWDKTYDSNLYELN